ncbi:dual specificity protein phosphatase 14-like [Oppia nitens]|uniref:dual specificity protein phosphatase 14-like n=1 Tax=Oppia nitens TaxID=1686743 RepID=UPI0023DA6266|nr:dual specificity protein phosphatase 14-like [Oppia nitens]
MWNWFSGRTGSQNRRAIPPQRTTTKTGQFPSNGKNRRLKTRREMEQLKGQLPEDFRNISEGTFAEMSKITNDLYLTGIFGLTKENFEQNNITNVINATYEAPDIVIKGISYIRVLVDDDPEEDITPYFDYIADNIESMARRHRHTCIHCVAGVSRSAALAIAYLIKYKNMTLKAAFNHIIRRRQCVKPITGFIQQLMDYELKIRGSNSCQLIVYKTREGDVQVTVPDFWIREHPLIMNLEIETERKRNREEGLNAASSFSHVSTKRSKYGDISQIH